MNKMNFLSESFIRRTSWYEEDLMTQWVDIRNGTDEIPIEVIKEMTDKMLYEILDELNIWWADEIIPEDPKYLEDVFMPKWLTAAPSQKASNSLGLHSDNIPRFTPLLLSSPLKSKNMITSLIYDMDRSLGHGLGITFWHCEVCLVANAHVY